MSSALRVFRVEDEAMIRMMVAAMLEELGHTIVAEARQLKPPWNSPGRLSSISPFST
jgi:AmiR/NasT family two-component response regulator